MTTLQPLTFRTPVLRVNDKDANIAFYEQSLGLRLVSEENALAFFSAWANPDATFMIEESPAHRTRATQGSKKLQRLVIKASQPDDVAQLLARDLPVSAVFEGKKGYAFEVLSPEQDLILLHAEDDVTSLKPVAYPVIEADRAFRGLTDFVVTEIALNVPDVSLAERFYDHLFQGQKPLELTFVKAEGADLQVAASETWDLEILSFTVPVSVDLAAVRTVLSASGYTADLYNKGRLLVVTDPSQIEIWIEKSCD